MVIEKKVSYIKANLFIKGIIKSIEDNKRIKEEVEKLVKDSNLKEIDIHILDSYIITSSTIGFLGKIIQQSKQNINVIVYNSELYELLENLNVIDLLKVKKGKK